jgi:hypothetical protein
MLATALGVAIASPAAFAGDACNNAWFSRNLIAHQAGHCFSSNLGKAVFGNAQCNGAGANYSKAQKDNMSAIAAMEKNWNCAVDTSRTSFNISNRQWLEKLTVQPVRDDTESSCIGFLGDAITLHAAPDDNAPVIGVIAKGDNVGDSYLPGPNGWHVAEVYNDSTVIRMGWMNADIWAIGCESYAG